MVKVLVVFSLPGERRGPPLFHLLSSHASDYLRLIIRRKSVGFIHCAQGIAVDDRRRPLTLVLSHWGRGGAGCCKASRYGSLDAAEDELAFDFTSLRYATLPGARQSVPSPPAERTCALDPAT